MSVERIRKLETLLERVRARARGPLASFGSPAERRSSLILLNREPPNAVIEVVESAPPEELSEDDVLDLSSDVLESVPPPPVVVPIAAARPASNKPSIAPPPAPLPVIDEDSGTEEGALEAFLRAGEEAQEEESPASSKRHRIPVEEDITGTLSAEAVREQLLLDEEHEVPIKTPPPESGPQEAPQGLSAPPPLSSPPLSSPPLSSPPLSSPALSSPPLSSPPLSSPLPPADLLEEIPLEPEVALEVARSAAVDAEELVLESAAAHASALISQPPAPSQVTARTPLSNAASPVDYRGASVKPERPKTFLELLEDSLRLGG